LGLSSLGLETAGRVFALTSSPAGTPGMWRAAVCVAWLAPLAGVADAISPRPEAMV
jgi:hypothetical protein